MSSKALTTKTMWVISRLGDFNITPRRAELIEEAQRVDPNGSINIDGNLISIRSIDGIITSKQYEELNAKKRGAWRCKFGYLHERFEQCAHYENNKMRGNE